MTGSPRFLYPRRANCKPAAMLVADLFASDDPATEIDQLARWAPQIPTWIIAGRNMIAEKRLQGRGFEVILFRPVDMGELVEQIKQRLER